MSNVIKHTVHIYKEHRILKTFTCGQTMYWVKGMHGDFYKKYWDGYFHTFRDAKKYIDEYEGNA